MSPLKVRRLHPDAKLPRRANDYAAGYDLFIRADENHHLAPGESIKLGTGIAIHLPPGTCGVIRPRSSAFMRGLVIQGLIDEDYRGEVFVVAHHVAAPGVGSSGVYLHPGDRIAQMVIIPYASPEVSEVEELTETERGANGFGSSGP